MNLFRRFFPRQIRRRDLTFLAVDTETTGLDPSRCAITEIGYQPVLHGELLAYRRMGFHVRPTRHEYLIDDHPSTIANDVAWRQNALGLSVASVIGTVVGAGEWLLAESGTRPMLAFHNAPFDLSFLAVDQSMVQSGSIRMLIQESCGPFARRLLDTQAMVQPLVLSGRLDSQSLSGICKAVGVKPGNHTAVDDARATAECVIELLTEGWL